MAFAISPSKALGNLALGGVLLVWLFHYRTGLPLLWRDPWGRLLLGYGAYLVLSVFIGIQLYPDEEGWAGRSHVDVALSLWRVPLAVMVVGWAISASGLALERLRLAFLLGLVAAILYPLLTGDVSLPAVAWHAQRTGFAMDNPNTMGLYASMGLLGIVLFPVAPHASRRGYGKVVAWVGALFLMLFALMSSQSRSSWAAITLALPILLLLRWWYAGEASIAVVRRHGAWIALVAGGTVVLVVWYMPTIVASIAADQVALRALFTGSFENVPDSSLGQRIQMWQVGVESWLRHPWFGNGPGSAEHFLAHSGNPAIAMHPHVHNAPLDLLVRTGFIGLLLMGSFFVLLGRVLLRAWREGRVEQGTALLLAGGLLLFLVSSLATFLLTRNQGLFFLALFGGMTYSLALRRGGGA